MNVFGPGKRLDFFPFSYSFIFGCPRSSCNIWAFPSCGKQGLLSSCIAWASHSRGFSCRRAQSLECAVSAAMACGLSCPAACGIFPDQRLNPCLLHWQADSQTLDHQGSPGFFLSWRKDITRFDAEGNMVWRGFKGSLTVGWRTD